MAARTPTAGDWGRRDVPNSCRLTSGTCRRRGVHLGMPKITLAEARAAGEELGLPPIITLEEAALVARQSPFTIKRKVSEGYFPKSRSSGQAASVLAGQIHRGADEGAPALRARSRELQWALPSLGNGRLTAQQLTARCSTLQSMELSPRGSDRYRSAPPLVMTIDDLAAYLQVAKSTLYKLAQEGKVPGQKVGRHWRFHRDAIDAWLQADVDEENT